MEKRRERLGLKTTPEGMTWPEWRQAALHGCPPDRNPREATLLRGFRAGHDPADYAAWMQRR